MNKFEQVSNDGHQMSLAGGLGVQCLMSRGVGTRMGPMSDVQGVLGLGWGSHV